jgi:hypothetical protein
VILAFYLASILTFYIAFYLAASTLTDILSGILSGMSLVQVHSTASELAMYQVHAFKGRVRFLGRMII